MVIGKKYVMLNGSVSCMDPTLLQFSCNLEDTYSAFFVEKSRGMLEKMSQIYCFSLSGVLGCDH
jgi:hypothetical protein